MRTSPTFLLIVIALLIISSAKAYDTLRITVRQADSIFLKSNYRLLASTMNIDAQRAQIIQARLYPNPIFTADINAYDPQNNEAVHINNSGQKAFQLEQLILLGGKRKAQIDLAKTNNVIAELEFQELVRQLKYELHASLHAINQQRLLLDKYSAQLALLDTIVTAYDRQVTKGNIAMKEIVRLKGVYLNLNNVRAELLKFYLEEVGRVQTILELSNPIEPIISENELTKLLRSETFDRLAEIAYDSRPDYKIARNNVVAAEQYYTIQRRLAVPDVNLMTSYDQRGGAFRNQFNVGLAIPLPLWSRNQGNIRTAKSIIMQNKYSEEDLKTQINIDIQTTLAMFTQTKLEYQKATSLYSRDFEITLRGMAENFQKRNVSMLEFVDFFEAYNDALAEISRIKIQLASSAEQLNLIVGAEIF
jgi:cobalt-zinc-cadmium efflux system outer membrane protein